MNYSPEEMRLAKELETAFLMKKSSLCGVKYRHVRDQDKKCLPKLVGLLQELEVSAQYYVDTAFSTLNRPPSGIFFPMLMSQSIVRAVSEAKLVSDVSLRGEIEDYLEHMALQCVGLTGQGDLTHKSFKKLMWTNYMVGVPRYLVVLLAYPEKPDEIDDFVKRTLLEAKEFFVYQPKLKAVCTEMQIPYDEIKNWKLFDGITGS
jgi:hypothetical protein